MKVHFIAIGGAAMHNLAMALVQKGYTVTGSDDEIYEPSLSRLKKHGILPPAWGWFPDKLDASYDAIILGMHARVDNPELVKAQELGLRIYSYPEFLYEQTKNKKRIVVGGSHGKTSVTSMIMHVLRHENKDFDFMVGALLEGFDCMVQLEDKNPIAVFEGDEYLASPIDRRPKFHLYHPHIAIITGIAWDHMNVFPTFENYVEQFKLFLDTCEPNAKVFCSGNDDELHSLVKEYKGNVSASFYEPFPHEVQNGRTYLITGGTKTEVPIFGMHNMYNLSAAFSVCKELEISEAAFVKAIASFKGASKRLETLHQDDQCVVLRDFAHSPSKVKATTEAVKSQFGDHTLIACLELHTFSSLNPDFIGQYAGSLKAADIPMVYFNPQTLEHKKLPPITPDDIYRSFNDDRIEVFTNEKQLVQRLADLQKGKRVDLLMSSGTYNGTDLFKLAEELAAK